MASSRLSQIAFADRRIDLGLARSADRIVNEFVDDGMGAPTRATNRAEAMTAGAPHDATQYDLPGLIPWLTRGEPRNAAGQVPLEALKSPALREPYDAATKNIQRADSVIVTIAAAFEALHRSTAQPPREAPTTIEDFFRIGLLAWAGSTIASSTTHIFSAGVHGVLQGYLVQAHSAFEAFAGDIWEAAVNAHPAILADMTGKVRTKRGDDPEVEVDEDPRPGKSIPLGLLREQGYDVSKCMGTLIRRAGHARFGTLSGMRQAFERAFRKDNEDVLTALGDPSLDVVAAIRNNIVHRAAIIDTEYLANVKGKALAPTGDVGEPLQLNGGMIAQLFLAAYPKAIGLISAVDDWLTSH